MPKTTSERLRLLRAARRAPSSPEQRGRKNEVRSNINVTPLVDVVLVLLIIFMVVTPMIASGVAVDLPRTAHHAKKPDNGKDIIVSVTWDKRLYLGSRIVPKVTDLSRAVADEKRRSPEKMVFLKGDARASYSTVREVMQALQATGVEDIVLGTEELVVER